MSQRLDDALVGEVVALTDNIRRMLSKVDAWTEFLVQSRDVEFISDDARRAATNALKVVLQQADDVVRPDLKRMIEEVSVSENDENDEITSFSLIRATSNIFKAISSAIRSRTSSIMEQASDSFNKGVGYALGGGVILAISTGAYESLTHLVGLNPAEFAWLRPLLELLKLLR